MNAVLEGSEQDVVARFCTGTLLARSPVTSTSTLSEFAETLDREAGPNVRSTAPTAQKSEIGSNKNFPAPADAKSNKGATARNLLIERINEKIV
jgi:hypothetical protein